MSARKRRPVTSTDHFLAAIFQEIQAGKLELIKINDQLSRLNAAKEMPTPEGMQKIREPQTQAVPVPVKKRRPRKTAVKPKPKQTAVKKPE